MTSFCGGGFAVAFESSYRIYLNKPSSGRYDAAGNDSDIIIGPITNKQFSGILIMCIRQLFGGFLKLLCLCFL